MIRYLLTDIAALTLPDIVAALAVGGIPLLLALFAWPLLRRRKPRPARVQATQHEPARKPLTGLARQWVANTAHLEDRIERQRHVVHLHRKAAVAVGALDFEVDLLLRDVRRLLARPDAAAA